MTSTSDIDTSAAARRHATQVPYRLFYDQDVYDAEQRHLFRGPTWNFVGLAAEVPEPGDFKASFVGDTPVVLTRDELRLYGRESGQLLAESPLLGLGVLSDAFAFQPDGSLVLVSDEGNSARQMLGAPAGPVKTVVVGVVDQLAWSGGTPTTP